MPVRAKTGMLISKVWFEANTSKLDEIANDAAELYGWELRFLFEKRSSKERSLICSENNTDLGFLCYDFKSDIDKANMVLAGIDDLGDKKIHDVIVDLLYKVTEFVDPMDNKLKFDPVANMIGSNNETQSRD